MIEYLRDYVSNIVFFLLLMVFVKMFLNNKSYIKYIDVILGFLLILILIKPITKIISTEEIDFRVWEDEDIDVEQYVSIGNNYAFSMSEKIIKNQLKTLLENYEYIIYETTISFDDEYNLEFINIILKDNDVAKIKIDSIEIEREGAIVESLEILEIKNLISDFYNLSLSHINVWIK